MNVIISDLDAITGVTALDVDNIQIDGNAIVSTDVNGDITITPNGTGITSVSGLITPYTTGAAGIALTDSDCGGVIWSTAEQDVDLPDCDAGILGCKIFVLNDDVSEATSVTTVAGDIISLIDGTALDAADEADLSATAHASGTFVCMAANNWYITAQVGVITDGGPAD